MSWWSALGALLGTVVAVWGPGVAALRVLGVRGLALAALTPVVSTAVLTGGAVLADVAGIAWSWPAALGATALAVLAALLLRRLLGPVTTLNAPPRDRAATVIAWAGAALAAVLAAAPLRTGMSGIRTPPSTPDGAVHLAALRAIADTGLASPLTVLPLPDVGTVLRPGGWHDVVSVAMYVGGADAVVAANVAALVLAGLVVPLGTGYASAALLPRWRWAAPLGMVAGTAFVALPTVVISFGTLWPFAWATGLTAALAGGLVRVLATCRWAPADLAVGVVGLGGVVATQVRPAFSLAVVALPLVGAALVARWRRLAGTGSLRRALAEAAAAVAGLLAAAVALVVVTADRPQGPPRTMSTAQAVGEALLDTPLSEHPFGVAAPAWLLGAAVLAGFLVALRRMESRPWALSWLAAVAVYALAAGGPRDTVWRRAITSWWLEDPLRIGTLLPVVAAPLVVVAADAARERWAGCGRHSSGPPRSGPRRADAVVSAAALLVVALLSWERADVRADRMRFDYPPVPVAAPLAPVDPSLVG